MKSLFNRYEAYNTNGRKLSDEIQEALDPIFKKWSDEGYKMSDIEVIAFDNISIISAITRLKKSVAMVKQKRNRPVG